MSSLTRTLLLVLAAMLLAVSLTSCKDQASNLNDGYQFGDLTREAIRLQDKYCKGKDIIARIALVRMSKELGIEVDGENICDIDIVKLLEGADGRATDR